MAKPPIHRPSATKIRTFVLIFLPTLPPLHVNTTRPLTSRHFLSTLVSIRLLFAMSHRFLWLPVTRGMLDNLIGAFYSLSKRDSLLSSSSWSKFRLTPFRLFSPACFIIEMFACFQYYSEDYRFQQLSQDFSRCCNSATGMDKVCSFDTSG